MNTPKHTVFLIHLAISATLMLMLISAMLMWWYPKGLFGVAGGWDGLKILLPIDMVLGPALTLFFYKPGKKSAVFDLSVIACVQLAALSYGVFAVYSQHTQALVLAEGELVAITPNDYKAAVEKLDADQQLALDPRDLDSGLPPVVVAKPYAREHYGQYVAALLNGGLELAHRAERYQDLQTGQDTFQSALLEQDEVKEKLGDKASSDYNYLKLKSMYGTGVAAFSKDTGELVQVYPVIKKPDTAALKTTD